MGDDHVTETGERPSADDIRRWPWWDVPVSLVLALLNAFLFMVSLMGGFPMALSIGLMESVYGFALRDKAVYRVVLVVGGAANLAVGTYTAWYVSNA